TPTGAQATLCFALILSSSWFLLQYMAVKGIGSSLATIAAGQFLILFPPLIMAVMLTSAPGQTLRVRWPAPRYLAFAVALAVVANPLVRQLGHLVETWFPISPLIKESLAQVISQSPELGVTLGVFALLPAICEEFAFRGFILSGLEHQRRTRSAIFLSALMFGFLHVLLSLFQQLFNAALLGIVLGLLAVRSRSIVPGILFHFLNNALAVTQGRWVGGLESAGLSCWLFRNPAEGLYHGFWLALSLICSTLLFYYLWKIDRPDRVEDDPLAVPATV
ncbi:MAG: CPBP family intramembrane metalloprotease, partial [Planctomycetaceae bacterium]|nr:CPBP family intramembrane metalloprotease [Planctomycetaceae bacterium]